MTHKFTPREQAIYRAAYTRGKRAAQLKTRTFWYEQGIKEGYRRAVEEATTTSLTATPTELEQLTDAKTEGCTTPEQAAEFLGWRLRRARRVWNAQAPLDTNG